MMVSAGSLQQVLDGPLREVRAHTRAILDATQFAPVQHETMEAHRARVLAQARDLAAAGGTGLGFPVEYGGGGDVAGSIAAFETLAFADLSLTVKCGVQFGLFGGAVLHLGTQPHHERYLPRIISLDLPGCFAMTETGHGSNVAELETTATYDPASAEFVITTPTPSARKDYIGGAARDGRLAAVFAQLETRGEQHGVHCFLVPIRDDQGRAWPGVEIGDCGAKAGLHGVDNGRLQFHDVRVPRAALLDRFASVAEDGTYSSAIEHPGRRFFTMLGTLVQGRVCVAGGAVSATKVALAIAVRYGEQRRQFGPPGGAAEVPVLDYLSHQRRLLPALAATYALSFVQHELSAELGLAFTEDEYPERARRELEAKAAGVKAVATWHATRTIQECREACGGAGYLSENRLPHLKADTDVFTTFEGDNTVLLQLVAKSLLTDYRDRFGELDAFGTARFVADQVVDAVVERTAARSLLATLKDAFTRGDDTPARAEQLALLVSREEHTLESVARRLRSGMDKGGDPFEVFNACQDHLLHAGRAHVERLMLEAFAGAVDACEDAEVRDLLGQVCALHGLATIERDRGWFLEHGRLTAARSKAITAAINELCRELRPHARLLVDAFAIPDVLLAAPIALDPAAPMAHPDVLVSGGQSSR